MSTEHNWPEDFSHENGNYNNDCYMCKTVFIGYKRRHVCRVCATPQSIRDQLAHLQSQLDDLKAFVQKDVQEKGEYGRCGYGQPTRRALEAQALLASIDAATSALTAQDKGAT